MSSIKKNDRDAANAPSTSVGTRILLVEDDDLDAVRVTRIVNRTAGFELLHERSLAKAIPIIAKQAIDVVLLDLGLSDCSCLKAISALSDLCDAPIIVLSGEMDTDIKATVLELGAHTFLSKSSDLERDLLGAITNAVAEASSVPTGPTI